MKKIEFVSLFSNAVEIPVSTFNELVKVLNHREEYGVEYMEGVLPKDIDLPMTITTRIINNNTVAGYEPTEWERVILVAKEGDRVEWNSGSPAVFEHIRIERN